jgi:histidyl-tRNA synthetase
MTPTLARMVASQSGKLRKPIRWFSIPQLFRYERQQRGRLREHFQLNCDLIGEAGPLGDAELIALAVDIMRAFGLGPRDVRVRLSDRRVLTAILKSRGVPASAMGKAFEYIDKIERMRKAQSGSGGDAFAPATAQDLWEVSQIRDWSTLEKELARSDPGAIDNLREVRESLVAMGLGDFIEVDLTIVRGLAYYTGTVFELFDADRTLRAICGGGRYDDLLQAVGGVQMPAVGFGMGDVVLGELLREKGRTPSDRSSIDVFLAFITRDELPHAMRLAHDLRDAGLRVEYALSFQAVGKQLKLADARKAKLAIVVGPDEWTRGEVMMKDLRSGSQESVPANSLVNTIKARLNG